ncbi:hypothetical protein [Bacillus kwashiorkori]|uniref:hypothetical protein n=1 Tax=Bacillus kwashiorkori TaxID=1522318 RepID=UPI0007804D7D|nr:hypothetical protein [Bacillus kwashiorkori]
MGAKHEKIEVTEELVEQFFYLSKQAKEIDRQLSMLKKIFNDYLDEYYGRNERVDLQFDRFQLQRQVRVTEKYDEPKVVEKLEKLNLTDCIKVEKRPDGEKIQAAITLGLLKEEDLQQMKIKKTATAISVKEK